MITNARFGTRLGMDPKLEDMMWTSLTDFYTKVGAEINIIYRK